MTKQTIVVIGSLRVKQIQWYIYTSRIIANCQVFFSAMATYGASLLEFSSIFSKYVK